MEIVEKALNIVKKKINEKKFQDSEILCDQILKIDPKNIHVLELMAITKKYLEKPEESLKYFKKIVSLSPNNYNGLNNLGLSYMKIGNYEKSIECFTKASTLDKNKNHHWKNLACVFREKGEFEKSINFYQIALKNYANDDESLVGLAESNMEVLNIKEAIKLLKQAIKINRKNTAAAMDLAYAYFLNGEFEKGYKQYQNRFKHYKHLNKYKNFKKWRKEKGKILLFCEQGIGDLFNFLRFGDLVENASLLVPENTYDLLSKQNFKFKIIKKIEEDFDYQYSILDLPYLFKTYKNKITKNNHPYIKSIKKFNFNAYKDYIKIGICWAGNPNHPRDRFRSCNLNLFKKIKNKNIKLFSLQKDTRKRYRNGQVIDLCENCDDMKVVNMSPFIKDWTDTAGIIEEMDVVISVDTSILHLSSAMGKKTIGLLPYLPDWRWGIKGENIWYQNLKLIKQNNPGDWEGVFQIIKSRTYLN